MPHSATILVVDDQASARFLFAQQLGGQGYRVLTAACAAEGLALLGEQQVDLILSDLVMPEVDGLAFLASVRQHFPTLPFIVITANGSIGGAVEAVRQGAFDYVTKHQPAEVLQLTVERALSYRGLADENARLRHQFQEEFSFANIVTASPAMQRALRLAASVARAPQTTVALTGESGCGKEVLARAIHVASGGLTDNFVGVNCAAIPEALLESELFGHVRGAFTGAEHDRTGKLALARRGTLLLDEVGDMPLPLQAKLLRVLEERSYEKVGSSRAEEVDCRVIVATHRNLRELVQAGRFREDLYHRVNVFPIAIPPLRERREDIPLLTGHFMNLLRRQLGKPLPGVSDAALELLCAYAWPGNVRELRNCLERAAILVANGEAIGPQHLYLATPGQLPEREAATATGQIVYHLAFPPREFSLAALTERVLTLTLERCGGNKSQAAALLKVNRKMFYRQNS